MKVISLITLILLFSCAKVEPLTEKSSEESYVDYIMSRSQYIEDKSSDIFEDTPWYSYDENNHIIWPTFSVYALRTNNSYYKLQILDYYDKNSNPGHFTIRVAKENESEKIFSFKAAGCGNIYTNSNYETCLNNPLTNIYRYLNIETGVVYDLTDTQAKSNSNWDLAFNGTSVRLNAGKYGNKGTRIASLFIYTNFFQGGIVDYQRIAEVSFSDRGSRFFDLEMDLRNIPYSLPPGVDRVINEKDWFKASEIDERLYTSVDENWWLIRSSDHKSYFKFNMAEINESLLVNEKIETEFVIHSYYQSRTDVEFQPELRIWHLEPFNTKKRLIRLCLDLDAQKAVHCSREKDKVDISFTALNRVPRLWKIETKSGAIGPLSFEDISNRNTGRLK